MRTPHPVSMLAAGALLVLGACGGDSDTTSDTTTAPGAVDDTVADVTDTTDAATSTSTSSSTSTSTTSTSSTSTTAPTTVPDPDATCVQGEWLLAADATAALYSTLLPGFPLNVAGTQTLAFDGGNAEQYMNLVLEFRVPTVSVDIPLDVHDTGTYAIGGGILTMVWSGVEGGISPAEVEWVDDSGVDAGTYQMIQPLLADIELPRYGGGPITCDGDTLTLGFTSGLADATAVYTRL